MSRESVVTAALAHGISPDTGIGVTGTASPAADAGTVSRETLVDASGATVNALVVGL
jgi:hypothetical protein